MCDGMLPLRVFDIGACSGRKIKRKRKEKGMEHVESCAPPHPKWAVSPLSSSSLCSSSSCRDFGPQSPRRDLNFSKITRLGAFMKMSDILSAEGMRTTCRMPSRTLSCMEWYLMRKCFMFKWYMLSCDSLVAASLSQ